MESLKQVSVQEKSKNSQCAALVYSSYFSEHIILRFDCNTLDKGPFIFYERGGAGGILGGGALEKNSLERGGQPKKNEGRGGSDEKTRLKIG